METIRLKQTTSTNDYLRSCPTPPHGDMTVVTADCQTAGRGQGSNTWESEPGKNLTLSILTSPATVPVASQFVLSMAGALALKATLDAHCADISLKWPNDIYWRDRKISGTLIETSVKGRTIERCVYGIGLNVNQATFRSDAPNPVSLLNITGRETPLDGLLGELLRHFEAYHSLATNGHTGRIVSEYNTALYRRTGMHAYTDTATGHTFMARISHVGTDGLLHLVLGDNSERAYSLKEVRFVI